MNKETILKCKYFQEIFPESTEVEIKKKYRALAKVYRADIDTTTNKEVMQKITELYKQALKSLKSPLSYSSDSLLDIEIVRESGQKYLYKYRAHKLFELGEMYICNNRIVYIFNSEYEKYYKNAIENIYKIKYPNENIKAVLSKCMPSIIKHFKTDNGKYIIEIAKTPEVFNLRGIYAFYNGKVPDKHVAWMVSRLSNIACLLSYNDISMNSINLDTMYCSPNFHTILPLGGWWYASNVGDKLIGTSKDIYDIMDVDTKQSKITSLKTDLDSIKLLGKTLLGNVSLLYKPDEDKPPEEIIKWLNYVPESAFDEYSKWDVVLDKTYGQRKFIKMAVIDTDIYK